MLQKSEVFGKSGKINIDSIKIRRYVPIQEKAEIIRRAIDRCIVHDADGFEYIDYTKLRVEYIICVMHMYTDLHVKFDVNDFSYHADCYDVLQSENYINLILDRIADVNKEFSYTMDDKSIPITMDEVDECRYVCDCIMNTYKERISAKQYSRDKIISDFITAINNIALIRS